MFSMAVLAAMVSIALDMVIRVAAAFWTSALINSFLPIGAMSDGMNSQAMQQGGMGIILTALILTAPPMAAAFFQGTLGAFMAYSQIGGGPASQPGAQGQPPGSYTPPQTRDSSQVEAGGGNQGGAAGRAVMGSQNTYAMDTSTPGRQGNAPVA